MKNQKTRRRAPPRRLTPAAKPPRTRALRASTALHRWMRHSLGRTLQWTLSCLVIAITGFLLVASADAQTPWSGPSAGERLGTAYMYDEDGSLLSETGTGGPNSSDSIQHIYLPTANGPMPVAVIINGAMYAVHSDHLNTPRRITNASGETVWQWAYSTFGEDAPTTAANRFSGPNTVPKTGSTAISPITYNIRYPGTYFDNESGLLENGYRSYVPTQGRYTQGDPIGLNGGWSRFNYVDGNPLGATDPTGLMGESSRPPYPPAYAPVPMTGPLRSGFEGVVTPIPVLGGGGRGRLPDSALVCRGGACRADSFANGAGVGRSADGTLSGVSTQCRPGASLEELAGTFRHNQVGVTSVGNIQAAGGRVTMDGTRGNPNHATVDGLNPAQLEQLFSPTIPNPVPPSLRR